MNITLVLLFGCLFTWGIGEGMFFIFQPIYMAELGASTMTIATVFSAFGASMMITHIPAGYLADRIGRKPLLIAAWTTGLVSTSVMALARTLPMFIVGMLLYGLTAFVSAPLNSYVTAARGKFTPARVMTFMSAAFNLGAVIGPLAGGWIGGHFGLRTTYFIAAGVFAISTILITFLKPQPRHHHEQAAQPLNLLANKRFLVLLAVVFIVMFATYLPQPLTARFLEQERGLSLESIGLLSSVNGLGNAIFNLFLGQFSSRLGLLLVQVCVASFSLLIWRGTGLGWYAAAYFILGGYRTARAFIFSTVRGLTHFSQMGLAYGVAETFNALASVLAPLLAGFLYTYAPGLVYRISLALLVLAIFVTLAFLPNPPGEAQPVNPTLEI